MQVSSSMVCCRRMQSHFHYISLLDQDTSKESKATKSEGRCLEEGASRAKMTCREKTVPEGAEAEKMRIKIEKLRREGGWKMMMMTPWKMEECE